MIVERSNDSLKVDRMLPMIYKPAPWKDIKTGAYYSLSASLMRVFPGFNMYYF